MPKFDKTGPKGKGPKTGRGLGNCETNKPPRKDLGLSRKVRKPQNY